MIQPEGTHLAQLNVGVAVDDIESARLAEFIGALEAINRLAERSEVLPNRWTVSVMI
ncbi:MAG: hypothetical protein O3B74_12155 [Proteobacteria bacterium]|nr:hypothetical protein [Pseudomonadota bacterium]